MPTKLTRISVSLSPEVETELRKLCDVSGASMGGYVGALLEQSLPVIVATRQAFESAQENQAEASEILSRAMADVVTEAGVRKRELDEAIKGRKKGGK